MGLLIDLPHCCRKLPLTQSFHCAWIVCTVSVYVCQQYKKNWIVTSASFSCDKTLPYLQKYLFASLLFTTSALSCSEVTHLYMSHHTWIPATPFTFKSINFPRKHWQSAWQLREEMFQMPARGGGLSGLEIWKVVMLLHLYETLTSSYRLLMCGKPGMWILINTELFLMWRAAKVWNKK